MAFAAAILGWAALGGVAPVTAQPTEQWVAREFQSGVNGGDEGVDAVIWRDEGLDPAKSFVYVAATVAISSSRSVIGVYKYWVDETSNPQTAVASRLYPPVNTATGVSKPTAITVDPDTGDVYVVGETPVTGNAQDIVVLKLDKDLVHSTTWGSGGGPATGVRVFNGTGDDNDRATDVMLDGAGMVYVLGTSRGNGTLDDLVIVKYEEDGDRSSTWDDESDGVGVRRWNNGSEDGHDTACRLTGVEADSIGELLDGWHVVASGTTDNGDFTDFVVVSYDEAGDLDWAPAIYGGADYTNDVATCMARNGAEDNQAIIFVGGYSTLDTQSNAAPDYDYTVVAINFADGSLYWDDVGGDAGRHWDGPGTGSQSGDICRSMAWYGGSLPGSGDYTWLWLTGTAHNGDDTDFGTVVFDAADGSEVWVSLDEMTSGRHDHAMSIYVVGQEAYVTGAAEDGSGILDYFTIRLDADGDLVWSKSYDGNDGTELALCVLVDETSGAELGVIVTGGSYQTSTTGVDAVTIRYEQP
ncbi:MAG: hypothetical protein ACKVU4_09220 [Phycisphaerales bacterium]